MSLAQKNSDIAWQPSATLEVIQQRARIVQAIRAFFGARGVLEVDTPLLCRTSVTDPHIESMRVHTGHADTCFLQTSPEYAMKRLLAFGIGSIYQISKAFRQEENGRYHNPEFTLLEWYRVGFTHHDLMNEVDDLLQCVLQTPRANRFSYAALFEQFLTINPHQASLLELKECAHKNDVHVEAEISDKDTWLQLLLSHCIEPHFAEDAPAFIYDFPVSQAALSRIQHDQNPPTAARFEVYYRGIELANGFFELQDAEEQRKRFEKNIEKRKQLGNPLLACDEHFLAALSYGLPDCAGVALGLDRLVMLAVGASDIASVLAFDFTRV
ncbi:MAG TPA: EF-P lysine aminoacylase EpmA [Gammaproteobacteria bacterium]|jgi:lysyl-tRNA synthetase class 2|nr:EF-P lysine aminoacylase EpmA [Gammaproteobacteria bacterium]